MRKFSELIKDIPFIILLVNGICLFYHESEWYSEYYFLISQISGSTILTTVYMLFYAFVHRFCLYSKVCIISLGVMNIFNLTYYFISLDYYHVYAYIIITTGLIFGFIRYVKLIHHKIHQGVN